MCTPGAKLAVELAPDLVLFDGSGAALPPVETRRRILVVNAQQDPAVVTGYLNAFRHFTADLVILTMAEAGSGWEELRDAAAELAPAVVGTVLRPRPAAAVSGRRVAFFSTAPDERAPGLRAAPRRRAWGGRRPRLRCALRSGAAARGARVGRCRRLPRRAEGSRDRRRRRGGRRARAWRWCSRAATSGQPKASPTWTPSCFDSADEACA